MSFENYNKGNIQKNDSVNSRGVQFKNRQGFVSSTLVIQYWDDKLNLILHPELKNPSEKQVYDYEQKIMITLRVDKAMSLLKALDLIIDKAIEEGKEASVAVTTGNNNMAVVSTALKENSLHVVLTVCRDLNVETKVPNQKYSYTFIKDEEIVKGYDPKTGSFDDVMEIQSEYLVFKEALASYIEMMQQTQTHSDRYFDRFYRNSIMDKVTKIGLKLGALDSGHYTGSYGSTTNRSAFANVNQNNADAPSGYTPTTSLDDLKDIF